jgi:hypothetical protein
MKYPLLVLFAALPALADVPGWLKEVATAAHPKYPPQTRAVVLFHEEKVTLDETGRQITTTRKAIKILTVEGKGEAEGAFAYDNKDAKVRDIKAWVMQPSGKIREFGKKEVKEENLVADALYSSMRYVTISGKAEVDPEAVFGFESTVEEKTIFTQFRFLFQTTQPHLLSRFQLTVPAGWRAVAKGYEGANATPTVEGSTYTWEARVLPFVEREVSAPRTSSLLPRIAVSALPPAGATSALPTFEKWKDVSVWQSQLTDSQSLVNQSIEAKAKSLVAGKSGVLDQVRAIAEYVQGVRYVSIQTNLSKGGGYVPHSADEVLRNEFGDCKDKANLLRALLKVINVPSHLTAIFSGDSRYTQEDWPSPMQFNHEILAIVFPEDTKLPASLRHPELGNLLFFDPTDHVVPLGYMPDHEQNSQALIIAGEKGALVRTPITPPAANHLERRWAIAMSPDGKLEGTFTETATGQEAFDLVRRERNRNGEDLRKIFDARFAAAIPGSRLTEVDSKYDAGSHTYTTKVKFAADTYAKVMKDRLWIVKSTPMAYYGVPNLSKPTRTQPVILEPISFSESVEWTLPDTLKLDEMPDADGQTAAFGKHSASWKADGLKVSFQRSILMRQAMVPAAEYKATRDFFLRFNGIEAAPIVLVKK